MRHGTLVRRHSLTLLIALGIGFLGRVVATVAMPLPIRQGVPRPLSTATSIRPKCFGCGNALISGAGGLNWWRGGICGS
jgi:hypothetical protein